MNTVSSDGLTTTPVFGELTTSITLGQSSLASHALSPGTPNTAAKNHSLAISTNGDKTEIIADIEWLVIDPDPDALARSQNVKENDWSLIIKPSKE